MSRVQVALGLALLASGAMGEPCDCSKTTLPRCTASQLTSAEGAYLKALKTLGQAGGYGDVKAMAPQPHGVPLLDLSAADAKRVFEGARAAFGDQALAAAMGRAGPGLPKPEFNLPNFRRDVARAATLLHTAGPQFFLHASPDMTRPGTPAPGIIPAAQPVRIVPQPQGPCWTPLKDPLKPAEGGMQLAGAFGLNFPEVGRIVQASTEGGALHLDNGCAFVLLSPRWAVTALHCVTTQEKEGADWKEGKFRQQIAGTWRGELGVFLGQTQRLASVPQGCFGLGNAPCPWKLLRVERLHHQGLASDPDAAKLPKTDIALLELRPSQLSMPFPTFAFPDGSPLTATLVAYGAVAPPFWTFFELQVGWNFSAQPSKDGLQLFWNPNETTNQSSICRGDSGGAVYEGYENGGCDCKDGAEIPRQRRLAGIISYVYLQETDKQPTPALLKGCRNSERAGAVVPAAHRSWICSKAPEVAACK